MKSKSITIRLSETEYNILNRYKDMNQMNTTQIISSLLKNNIPQNQHQQEIVTTICKIYIRLEELGLHDEEITKEVQRLCQMLS